MKKIVLLLPMMFMFCGLSANATQDDVNTDVATTDDVVEQVSSNVSMAGDDGTHELATTNGSHNGLDFSADLGYNINTKGGGGFLSVDLGLGKRFNKNFYGGIGSGVYVNPSGGNVQIPFTADFKAYFPLTNSSIVPGGLLRVGYLLNTAGDTSVGTGKSKYTVKSPDYIMLQIMPTVQFPLTDKLDLNFGIGYTHFIATTSGIGGSGAVTIRAGIGLHSSIYKKAKSQKPEKPKKPRNPTRENGVQMTIEGGYYFSEYFGGGPIFTYKWNSKLSFGLGLGVDYIYELQSDEIHSLHIDDLFDTRLFLRGTYRFLDTSVSPFVSLDAGVNFRSSKWHDENDFDLAKVGAFITPSVGASFRVASNSYLELKFGYLLSTAVNKTGENKSGNTIDSHLTMNKCFIMIGFTHTFSWGEHWFGK